MSEVATGIEFGIMKDVGPISYVGRPDFNASASSTAFRNWAGGK